MPEKESEPPQLSPNTNADAGTSTRLNRSGLLEQSANVMPGLFYHAARAAALLQGQPHQTLAATAAIRFAQVVIDLIHFAAQADHDGGGDIGVIQHTLQRALQLAGVGPIAWPQPSPCGNDTIPSTFGRQLLPVETPLDEFDGMRGAIAGCDHRNIVSGSDPPVCALETEE